jgi:PIN domain nuclease of toxin-antitoxin system
MRVLLDTHAFLWFLLQDSRLSKSADLVISDPANDIEISPASYWEIAIKVAINKYALPIPYQQFIEAQLTANDFRVLHIEPKHTAQLIKMPFHHRDPFDRLLIAQAQSENLPIVSADAKFDAYGVSRLW